MTGPGSGFPLAALLFLAVSRGPLWLGLIRCPDGRPGSETRRLETTSQRD